jgi:hypothetical protein
MESRPYVDEATCVLLNRLLPDFAIELKQHIVESTGQAGGLYLDLPAAPSADYHFRLWVSPEIQISAVLLSDGTSNYFWYMPFESAAYGNLASELQKALDQTLESLISHETRITQKRGLLFHTFKCEFKSPRGWKRVYGHSALRYTNFQPPQTAERKRVYRSPAIQLR